MTVAANSRRKEYPGNGVTTIFNGPMAYERAHVQAYLTTAGVTSLLPSSGYVVERLAQEAGTRIIFNVPPASGSLLTLLRTMPYTQDVDITNQGAFHAETVEKGYDALAMQIQQLDDGSMQQVYDPEIGTFAWDARGVRIIRVGDGINLTDAVNLRQVLGLIEGGGGPGSGVNPKSFAGIGTEDDENTIFDLVGPEGRADVAEPLLYRVYVESEAGNGEYVARPAYDGYTINTPPNSADPLTIQFMEGLADGQRWFAVLVGYARPYTGPAPISRVSPRVFAITGDMVIDGTHQNGYGRCTSATDVTLTIRENTGALNDWDQGDFFSVVQEGAGRVILVMEDAGAIGPPQGFLAQSRAPGATITALCKDTDALQWQASGDLLRVAQAPDVQCFKLEDRSVLIGTNIAAGTGKASFFMPFDFLLSSVADGGIYATLAVPQAAGAIVTVDVNRNGTSILSTKLTIDNTEKSSATAATLAVYAAGGNQLGKGDEITIDVDQIGTAAARGLTVVLVGQRAS